MSYNSRLATEERIIERLDDGDEYFALRCLKLMVEKGKIGAAHIAYLTSMYNQYVKARKLHKNVKWFISNFQLYKLSNILKSYKAQLAVMMEKPRQQITQEQIRFDF